MLAVALAGCAPGYRLEDPSRFCVVLPAGVRLDADARKQVIASLDEALGGAGYRWSEPGIERGEKWTQFWRLEERKAGGNASRNSVGVVYMPSRPTHAEECHLRVDVYADVGRPQGEREWRTFFLLRNDVLPALLPGSTVRTIDHPAFGTWPWDLSALAARFADGEELPKEIVTRIDAHERRSAIGRWLERTGAEMSTTWKQTVGPYMFGMAMYLLFPVHWIVFLLFAAAASATGVVRNRVFRTTAIVALGVVMLTPIKVPTLAGGIFVPQASFIVTDFHVGHYLRDPLFAMVAWLSTGVAVWLLLRLVRQLGRFLNGLFRDVQKRVP